MSDENTDIAIHEVQQTMDTAECFITASIGYGDVWLVCERAECRPDGNHDGHFREILPRFCLPEFAVLRRARHLATHVDAPKEIDYNSYLCG